jgi:rsbT co-antagonist protein RsbR
VAEQLAQTAQAVRYMGCQLVLVGIRTHLAQTLVELELHRTGAMTFADLQRGLEHALRAVRRRIVEVATDGGT